MVCPVCNATTTQGRPCKRHTCKFAPKCHSHTKVAVQPSNIPGAGRGLFARDDIRANEVVANYTLGTQRLTPAQFRQQYPNGRATHVWASRGNRVYYDASDASKSVAGMANTGRAYGTKRHNNAKITERGTIRALEPIPRGREILVSYGKGYRL